MTPWRNDSFQGWDEEQQRKKSLEQFDVTESKAALKEWQGHVKGAEANSRELPLTQLGHFEHQTKL